jgi:hypothetical protein
VIVSFEFCILLAVFATLVGIALHTRLPSLRLPEEYDPRFSRDHYGILVYGSQEEMDQTRERLLQAGALEVRAIAEIGSQKTDAGIAGEEKREPEYR